MNKIKIGLNVCLFSNKSFQTLKECSCCRCCCFFYIYFFKYQLIPLFRFISWPTYNCSGLPWHKYSLSKTYFRTYNRFFTFLDRLKQTPEKNPSYQPYSHRQLAAHHFWLETASAIIYVKKTSKFLQRIKIFLKAYCGVGFKLDNMCMIISVSFFV